MDNGVGGQVAAGGNGPHDKLGDVFAQQRADGKPYDHHQQGMEQIVDQDRAVIIAQRLEGTNVHTGIFNEPVHGTHHHQHRAQEKQGGEEGEDGYQVVFAFHQGIGGLVVLQRQDVDHFVAQRIIDGFPDGRGGNVIGGGDTDLGILIGSHHPAEDLLVHIGEGETGQVGGGIGGVDVVEALRVLAHTADLEPQVDPQAGEGDLVPVTHLQTVGGCVLVAEEDFPAVLGQGAFHNIRSIDGKIGHTVEGEGQIAVIAVLGIQHHPGLHTGNARNGRQIPAVPLIQAGTGDPVIGHILGVVVVAHQPVYIVNDAAEAGIHHHGDHGDDAHRDQPGGGAPQVAEKVFPDHATTPVPVRAPGWDSLQRIRSCRSSCGSVRRR